MNTFNTNFPTVCNSDMITLIGLIASNLRIIKTFYASSVELLLYCCYFRPRNSPAGRGVKKGTGTNWGTASRYSVNRSPAANWGSARSRCDGSRSKDIILQGPIVNQVTRAHALRTSALSSFKRLMVSGYLPESSGRPFLSFRDGIALAGRTRDWHGVRWMKGDIVEAPLHINIRRHAGCRPSKKSTFTCSR